MAKKTFTFNITQDLKAFYEAKVSIEAKNADEARKKLEAMSTEELNEIATDWEVNTDNAEAEGEIEIQDLV